MYLSHYHLEKEPFKNSPDPAFFWPGGKHGEAIATLREGILERDGCLLLTGDIEAAQEDALVARLGAAQFRAEAALRYERASSR